VRFWLFFYNLQTKLPPLSSTKHSSFTVYKVFLRWGSLSASRLAHGQDKSTPCIREDKSTPCITENKSTPCITEDKSTPCIAENKSTPCITEDKSTPCITGDKSTPCIAGDKSTLCITEDKSTLCTTEDKSTPCITVNCGKYSAPNTNLHYSVQAGGLSLGSRFLSLKYENVRNIKMFITLKK
jgi:hypothetical protein